MTGRERFRTKGLNHGRRMATQFCLVQPGGMSRSEELGLPRYVERDFSKYLECGVLAHRFARVRCASCKDYLFSGSGLGSFGTDAATLQLQGHVVSGTWAANSKERGLLHAREEHASELPTKVERAYGLRHRHPKGQARYPYFQASMSLPVR